MLQASRDELLALVDCAANRRGERVGVLRVGAHGGVAARFVHRGVDDATTGTPQAIASTIGMPKPS